MLSEWSYVGNLLHICFLNFFSFFSLIGCMFSEPYKVLQQKAFTVTTELRYVPLSIWIELWQ